MFVLCLKNIGFFANDIYRITRSLPVLKKKEVLNLKNKKAVTKIDNFAPKLKT